jgi:hypothetical protein
VRRSGRAGRLVGVTAVRRLHPRHWDGRRLLQFLTGLALLALAFGTPAASTAPGAPPVTVQASGAGSAAASARPAASVADTATVAAIERAPAAVPAARGEVPPAPVRAARESAGCQHDGSRVGRLVPPAADSAALAGVAQQAHGSRAPPRRG